MAIAMMAWLLAIPLLGAATGLRSLTPMAAVCWFAYLGYLPVDGTWAGWTGRLWVAIVFTVLAAGEMAADKTSWIPDRTSPPSLLWRLLLGGMAGSIAATSMNGPGIEGVLLGVVGAALGTYCGFMIRRDLAQKLESGDWPVAFGEDLFAIILAVFSLHVITS
jgi:uncharacterized membrane protein